MQFTIKTKTYAGLNKITKQRTFIGDGITSLQYLT